MSVTLGEYQEVFLEEAEEQIDTLNTSLLELEKNPEDPNYINEIFRAAHSLKSSAAFVGLTNLSDLAHSMENLLQQVRDGERAINVGIIDLLFRSFDHIRKVVELVSSGESPDVDLSQVLSEIKWAKDHKDADLSQGPKTPSASETKGGKQESPAASDGKKQQKDKTDKANKTDQQDNKAKKKKALLSEEEKKVITDALKDGLRCYDLTLEFDPETPALWMRIQLVLQQLESHSSILKTIPDREQITDSFKGRKLKIILLTEEDEQVIYNTADVDQINHIEIKAIRLREDEGEARPEKSSSQEESSPPAQTAQAQQQEGEQQEEDQDQGGGAGSVTRSMDDLAKSISQTVKVPVKKLDDLLNNVAELVIANSGFYQIYDEVKVDSANTNTTVVSDFKNRIEQMTRIAKDLQSGIMNTRMIPIGTVFKRFNRLVRDLSHEFNKDINLELRGEETELDKKVIDALGEPLMHLIRNSVDHGLEPAEERKSLGKESVGTILLNAYQGGNRILVEVVDDGRGLDKNKIAQKALEKKLINQTQLETMSEDDILQLIFLPGFSTAAQVTDVSGRGVGMNVVKEVVSMLNGNVSVETEVGVGTKFVMTFPLTTAIIAAIMVRAGNELYAVPLSDVVETIKVSEEEISTIENHEVIYLRDDILSLVRLNRALGIPELQEDNQNNGQKKLPVVVVGYGTRKVGLVVDRLQGKQEIVIKSLEQNYKAIEGLSGASILGDGSIALILDVQAMINLAITTSVKMEEQRMRQRARRQDNGELTADDYFRNFGNEQPPQEEQQAPPQEGRAPQQQTEPQQQAASPSAKKETATSSQGSESAKVQPRQSTEGKADVSTPQSDPTPSRVVDQKDQGEKNGAADFSQAAKDSGEFEESEVPASKSKSESEEAQKSEPSAQADEKAISSSTTESAEEEAGAEIQRIRDEANQNIMRAAHEGGIGDMLLKPEELEELHQQSEELANKLGLTDKDMDHLLKLANDGVNRAAESLTQIVNKQVEMSVPDFNLVPIDQLGQDDKFNTEASITVILKMEQDLEGHILLNLTEKDAKDLVAMLYGFDPSGQTDINDDAISAIKEISNIVGSGILNSLGDALNINLAPSVPELHQDFLSSAIDNIIMEHATDNEYALMLNTEFFISENAIIGRLFVLPKTQYVSTIIQNLPSE